MGRRWPIPSLANDGASTRFGDALTYGRLLPTARPHRLRYGEVKATVARPHPQSRERCQSGALEWRIGAPLRVEERAKLKRHVDTIDWRIMGAPDIAALLIAVDFLIGWRLLSVSPRIPPAWREIYTDVRCDSRYFTARRLLVGECVLIDERRGALAWQAARIRAL